MTRGTPEEVRKKATRHARRSRGFSMAEVVTVIAILGVLAAIIIPLMQGSLSGSKNAIARNLVETMNQAVHRFNQTNYELLFTGVAPSGQDEMLILRTMQFRDPARPKPGSPYIRPDWNPDISSSSGDYRVMWSGALYQLLVPGQAGTGIKVKFDASDLTTPFVFPPGFTMAGK